MEFPFYTLPVGFPIDGEFTPGLGVFLGAYINLSENDIVGVDIPGKISVLLTSGYIIYYKKI